MIKADGATVSRLCIQSVRSPNDNPELFCLFCLHIYWHVRDDSTDMIQCENIMLIGRIPMQSAAW